MPRSRQSHWKTCPQCGSQFRGKATRLVCSHCESGKPRKPRKPPEPQPIVAYTHPAPTSTQEPDPRPGFYYVSAIDGGARMLAVGPFTTHRAALDRVDKVRERAVERDPRSHFYAFGTCRLPPEYANPPHVHGHGVFADLLEGAT